MNRILILVLILTNLASFSGLSQTLPEGFIVEVFVNDLFQPTQLDEAADGRIFVAERTGKIRVIENGILLEEPFYEVETETPGERGVTGLILHPDFDQNGFVYIYYTIPDTNRNRLIRVQASGNTASPDTEEEIFLLDPMWAAWHNGGGMAFNDQGQLILGVGDGTGWQSAEQMNTTLGKVLRINDDGSIPIDNPFYDETDDDQKAIWAIGIRNPYTMAKQNSTGRIFFNDVGNEEWEEVNEVIEGAHYGWGSIEGPIQPGQTAPDGYEDPLYAYDHDQGCAIVGATFYEPDVYIFPEEYHNQYLFMEHCQSRVYTMNPLDGTVSVFIEGLQYPNNIKTLRDGSILITEIFNNRILKISYTGDGLPGIVEQPQDQIAIPGEEVSFVVLALGEEELEYQWYLNGNEIEGADEYALTLMNVDLSMNGSSYHCLVSNFQGFIQSETAELTVLDDSRPSIEIFEPIVGSLYSAGDTLWFIGAAMDVEDGAISPDGLEWNIFFHHNVHRHSALTGLTGVSSGYYVIPDQGEVSTDVWFDIALKATDSAGLESEINIQIEPELVEFSVESILGAMEFSVDGSKKIVGDQIESVSKMRRTLNLEPFVVSANKLYKFESWDGINDENILTIVASDTVLSPEYEFLHEYIEGDETENVLVRYYEGTGVNRDLYVEGESSVINENWSLNGPFSSEGFPEENFSVVYSGSILAPYSGAYSLNILHDSYVLFEMEDSVLLESNVGTQIINDDISVLLEAGERYNFTLDYRHEIDFARINLSWEFSELENHTIPSAQLFAPYSLYTGVDYLNEIEVYPNPASGVLNLDFKEFFYTWIRDAGMIEIYNSKGKLVSSFVSDFGNSPILIDHLPAGVYFLKLIVNEESSSIKLVVE